MRNFIDLFTVRHYGFAHWRSIATHEVTSVEMYERIAVRQHYVLDIRTNRVRVG